jgi:hypothetical protein
MDWLACTELMATMAPPPAFRIRGTAAWQQKKVPFAFASMTASHISSVILKVL